MHSVSGLRIYKLCFALVLFVTALFGAQATTAQSNQFAFEELYIKQQHDILWLFQTVLKSGPAVQKVDVIEIFRRHRIITLFPDVIEVLDDFSDAGANCQSDYCYGLVTSHASVALREVSLAYEVKPSEPRHFYHIGVNDRDKADYLISYWHEAWMDWKCAVYETPQLFNENGSILQC